VPSEGWHKVVCLKASAHRMHACVHGVAELVCAPTPCTAARTNTLQRSCRSAGCTPAQACEGQRPSAPLGVCRKCRLLPHLSPNTGKCKTAPPAQSPCYPATAAVCPHSGAMTKLLMVPLASAKRLVLWYCAFTCARRRPWSGLVRRGSVACVASLTQMTAWTGRLIHQCVPPRR